MAARIKLLAFDNATPAQVIGLALTTSFSVFAEKYGFSKQEVSQCVTGYRPHTQIRDALAAELGVEREEINALLDGADRDGEAD